MLSLGRPAYYRSYTSARHCTANLYFESDFESLTTLALQRSLIFGTRRYGRSWSWYLTATRPGPHCEGYFSGYVYRTRLDWPSDKMREVQNFINRREDNVQKEFGVVEKY